jgi:hypothetical protein
MVFHVSKGLSDTGEKVCLVWTDKCLVGRPNGADRFLCMLGGFIRRPCGMDVL